MCRAGAEFDWDSRSAAPFLVMDRRIEPLLVVYVDVDNTLVKTCGDKRTPEGDD